jgi:hypothetical protein
VARLFLAKRDFLENGAAGTAGPSPPNTAEHREVSSYPSLSPLAGATSFNATINPLMRWP